MEFDLHENDGTTQVTETICYKTFLPIKEIMANIFKNQHEQLFKNMDVVK